MHEHEDAEGTPMELLGHVLHPSLPSIQFKPVRAWRLRAAVQHLLRRRKVSGRAVDVIIRHFTYAFLLNRGPCRSSVLLTNSFVVLMLRLKSCGPVSVVNLSTQLHPYPLQPCALTGHGILTCGPQMRLRTVWVFVNPLGRVVRWWRSVV